MGRLRGAALAVAAACATIGGAAEAAGAPLVHAHRGGSYVEGTAVRPENTLEAFRATATVPGVVLEMDAKLTADDVPVIFHDATLDRTTVCSGPVAARSLAQLADCQTDVLGSPGSSLAAAPTELREPIPTLAQALALARDAGATVNLEIKNQPTDADFDLTGAFAQRVLDVVVASGFPQDRLIVQSFWPPNLDVARVRVPGARLSYLTLAQLNATGPEYTALAGYPIVSPAWPVDAGFVARAHGYGKQVVPYTLNTPQQVAAAAAAGVDAVITDDPAMALRVLGLMPAGPAPGPPGTAAAPPAVRVLAPRTARGRSFVVRWRPLGAGAASYDVRVRRAGRSRALLRATSRTSLRFRARRAGRHEFLVRARNSEGAPASYARAVTTVRR